MLFTTSPLLNHTQRLKQLRLLAVMFSVCLFLPLIGVACWGYLQLEENTLDSLRQEANSLVVSVNRKFFKKLTLSNNLAAEDFSYYKSVYNPVEQQMVKSISPLSSPDLSALEDARNLKGLVGFFQFDEAGGFTSPVWPISLPEEGERAITVPLNTELQTRRDLAFRIFDIVSQSGKIQEKRNKGLVPGDGLFKIMFDLPDYLIFYRVVTVQDANKLQGYVVEREPYFRQSFADLLEKQRFSGAVLVTFKARNDLGKPLFFYVDGKFDATENHAAPSEQVDELQAIQILNSPLFFPLSRFALLVSTREIPVTKAMTYYRVFAVLVLVFLLGASYGFYRLAVNQLQLAEQRLNFVSSVSHELKTPLTSIRMYSEMLRDGSIASEQFKREYYDFIFNESERLARLINNILQLSNVRNQHLSTEPRYIPVTELTDLIRSKVASMLNDHGFRLNTQSDFDTANPPLVLADKDAMAQIAINIADNGIKFSKTTNDDDQHSNVMDLIVRHTPATPHEIRIEFRDYGPGVTAAQRTKMFDLFYRGGSELTRTTQGTGIGLALVKELMLAQQGKVEAARKQPGLALVLTFKAKPRSEESART